MWFAVWSVVAQAQVVDGEVPSLNAQLFRPSLDSQYTLWTNDSTKFENRAMMGRFMLHYTKDPLVYRSTEDEVTRVLSDVVQFDAMAGYQLGPVRMGLILPIYAYTDGDNRASSAGFGDLTVDLKGTVLDRETRDVGVALAGRLGLPTAAIADAPLGSDGLSWELEAIVDRELGSKAFIAANLGYRAIPDVDLENLEWQDSVFARLGLGYKTSQVSGLSAEIVTHAVNRGLSERGGIPAEVLIGGWGRAATGLKLRGGLGTSLSKGIGAPQLRAMFALSFEPNTDPDTDGDGIVDPLDDCKNEAEDLDGVADNDGCPEATQVTVVALDADGNAIEGATFKISGQKSVSGNAGDAVALFGGDYGVTVMAEGYKKLVDSATVPDAESHALSFTLDKEVVPGSLKVTVTDGDGTPIEGATWSAVGMRLKQRKAGESIKVPANDYALRVFAPGFRTRTVRTSVEEGIERAIVVELQPAKAQLEGERITINESVYFELGKADIKPESFTLLDEVSDILIDHSEITKLRIEGHTDSRGDDASNKALSQSRAEAVQSYLVEKGVSEGRLESIGYGEEKPLDTGETEDAWQKNRRVDFFVAGRR